MTVEAADKKDREGPLEGIRIVEYAVYHAGPGASAILGDMGAEVIKVESLEGDPERALLHLGGVRFNVSAPPGWSFLFELSNRNKKGICLDIKTPQGREILHRLVQDADVFLTNLRKSTKAKLGIDYSSLSKVNPKIIHANVSGYGSQGPMSDLGAYDPLGQAVSGMAYVTGSREPIIIHAVVLDQATSIAASHAILSALVARERRGVGQEVHVSLYSTALWLMHANLLSTSLVNINPSVSWDRSKNTPLRNSFRCKDGKWILGTNHPEVKYWPKFCRLTEQDHLMEDPRFADEAGRIENVGELVALFDQIFLTRTRDEWMEIFREAGMLFSSVQQLEEVLQDPQAIVNDYVVDFDHPIFGQVKLPGYPVRFSANRVGTRTVAPALGEHTDAVLKQAGYSEQDIERLRAAKVTG